MAPYGGTNDSRIWGGTTRGAGGQRPLPGGRGPAPGHHHVHVSELGARAGGTPGGRVPRPVPIARLEPFRYADVVETPPRKLWPAGQGAQMRFPKRRTGEGGLGTPHPATGPDESHVGPRSPPMPAPLPLDAVPSAQTPAWAVNIQRWAQYMSVVEQSDSTIRGYRNSLIRFVA